MIQNHPLDIFVLGVFALGVFALGVFARGVFTPCPKKCMILYVRGDVIQPKSVQPKKAGHLEQRLAESAKNSGWKTI